MSDHNLFVCEDYKKLNPDLHFETDEDYKTHWINFGNNQKRLHNKKLLEVSNEFGIEIIFYVGYYFYLFSNELLFDNVITTYEGMEAYYYFVRKEQLVFKKCKRQWVNPKIDCVMKYCSLDKNSINLSCWLSPNYKKYYKNNLFKYDKELLIISNKHNIEWGSPPINFIDICCLEKIINKLSDKYQLVYIRSHNIDSHLQYSYDETNVDFNDFELIKNKYNDKVIIFNDLFQNSEFKHMNYNLLKCYLFSSCDNYICVQGGATNLISYFAKHMIIYHKRGNEIANNVYTHRSFLQSPYDDLILSYTGNYDWFIKYIDEKF